MISKQVRNYGVWLLTLVTFLFLLYELGNFLEWEALKNHLILSLRNPLLYITFILPFLNFGAESLKWRLLLSPDVDISFRRSLGAVVGGVTTGIMTPARLGEIGARVMLLKNEDRGFGGAMFVVGSLIQTIITVVLGVVALIWVNNGIWIASTFHYLMVVIGVTLVLIIIFRLVKHLNPKLSVFTVIARYGKDVRGVSKGKLLIIIALSLFKYFVYSIQLFLVLKLFNPSLGLGVTFPLISIFYLGITFLPGFLLADLGVRGSLSIFLFSTVIQPSLLIIIPVFFLWILNSCLPALIGLWIIRSNPTR